MSDLGPGGAGAGPAPGAGAGGGREHAPGPGELERGIKQPDTLPPTPRSTRFVPASGEVPEPVQP